MSTPNSGLDDKLQEIFDRDCRRLEINEPHGVHDHKEAIAALHELIAGERAAELERLRPLLRPYDNDYGAADIFLNDRIFELQHSDKLKET